MPQRESEDLTQLLLQAHAGDAQASAKLLAAVYVPLRQIARQRMAMERPDHTLQATALVHECYLRLFGAQSLKFEARAQFYYAASEAMRRILVEHARARGSIKRGGDQKRVLL